MGLAGLLDSLHGQTVALDTSAFIYFIEAHPVYAPLVNAVFEAAEQGNIRLVASAVSLLEVLVLPYREGRPDLAQAYEDIFTHAPGLTLIDFSPALARQAARLRAHYQLQNSEAIQIATALGCGATVFVTHDPLLRQVLEIQVRVLGAEASV